MSTSQPQATNTPKPKCVSKLASTPIYLHTSAVGEPVGTPRKLGVSYIVTCQRVY